MEKKKVKKNYFFPIIEPKLGFYIFQLVCLFNYPKIQGAEEAAVTELSEDQQKKKDTPENSEKGLEPEKSTDEEQKEDEIPKLVVSARSVKKLHYF